jgi:hypothetical protein
LLHNNVTPSHYVDTNLMHVIVMLERSSTGIIHSVDMAPIGWYPKKQATVKTATYRSDIVAARICVEQVIDLHNTLGFISVPIREKKYMVGDNKSVVYSFMQLNAKLHTYHFMLSLHVRETIAEETLGFYFLPGDDSPAIILMKKWGFIQKKGRQKLLLLEALYEYGSIY